MAIQSTLRHHNNITLWWCLGVPAPRKHAEKYSKPFLASFSLPRPGQHVDSPTTTDQTDTGGDPVKFNLAP